MLALFASLRGIVGHLADIEACLQPPRQLHIPETRQTLPTPCPALYAESRRRRGQKALIRIYRASTGVPALMTRGTAASPRDRSYVLTHNHNPSANSGGKASAPKVWEELVERAEMLSATPAIRETKGGTGDLLESLASVVLLALAGVEDHGGLVPRAAIWERHRPPRRPASVFRTQSCRVVNFEQNVETFEKCF